MVFSLYFLLFLVPDYHTKLDERRQKIKNRNSLPLAGGSSGVHEVPPEAKFFEPKFNGGTGLFEEDKLAVSEQLDKKEIQPLSFYGVGKAYDESLVNLSPKLSPHNSLERKKSNTVHSKIPHKISIVHFCFELI